MKIASCALLLAIAPVALAQQAAPSKGAPVVVPAPGKTLATAEQYSACLDSADEARARQVAIQKRRAAYEDSVRQLQVELKAHMDAKDTIKPGSRQADAWNNNSQLLNARSAAINTEAGAIEKDIAEHNRLGNEARERCSNLQVTAEVREAVTAARQKKP